jgi:hypothetical protein
VLELHQRNEALQATALLLDQLARNFLFCCAPFFRCLKLFTKRLQVLVPPTGFADGCQRVFSFVCHKLEPVAGDDPVTFGLRNQCSTD